jgi:hypothetical protein
MKHEIGIVTHPNIRHAWLLDLPGCVVGGRDERELEAKLPLAIAEHVGWLRAHGQLVDDREGWEFVEEQAPNAGDGLFALERAPTPLAEMDTLIRRVELARADLNATVGDVPDVVLDWAPPREAFESFDSWAPDVRTIGDVTRHVYAFDVYYRDGLRDGPAAGISERVSDPAAEHVATIERLRALDDEERCRVWRPLRPGHTEPEQWTARKVIRRMISHERMHTAEILQRKTWILLGTPRAV